MGKIIDETGKRYGKLTVLKFDGIKKHYAYWLCKCDCGNKCSVNGYQLRIGRITTCGCGNKIKDETGNKYGLLTVISFDGLDNQGNAKWKCQCKCGSIISVRGYKLRNGWTKSCGCLVSHGEQQINTFLNQKHIHFINEYSFEDLNSLKGYPLRFDYAIFNDKDKLICLIEYQGEQHYQDAGSFGQYQREITDSLKKQYCNDNNIKLYEIKYDEPIEERLEQILNENLL